MNKEQLKINLLIEKLENVSGKKVIIKEHQPFDGRNIAAIGTTRDWKGKKYIKTESGWKLVNNRGNLQKEENTNKNILIFDKFVNLKRNKFKKEFSATDQDFDDSYGEHDLLKAWRDYLLKFAQNKEQIPFKVLDNYIELFGLKNFQTTFRGPSEQLNYVPKQ